MRLPELRRRMLVLTAIAAAFTQTAFAGTDETKNWPVRPIRLIVPFAAGSSSDIVSRLVAQKLAERLGQALVVENRPGASGDIGTEAIARAAPDGYTLGLANASTHTVSPNINTRSAFDPLKDFVPISLIGESPLALEIFPGLGAHNMPELIALAKARPGRLSFATAGPATLAGLAAVLFGKMARVEIASVPYRGSAQESLDVIEGRIEMQMATIPPTLSLVREGKLRALAVTGTQRSAMLPDVPTVAEQGLPGYDASLWQGIVAPSGLAPSIAQRLNGEVNAILRQPDMVEALAKVAIDAEPSTAQEFASRIAADLAKWRTVIDGAGIHVP